MIMTHDLSDASISSGDAAIKATIASLFETYGAAFSALVAGERTDMDVLLKYYNAPLRIVSAHISITLTTNADILSDDGIVGEIGRLQLGHLAGSSLAGCDVRVLNPQAALVEARWLRRGAPGEATPSSFAYLVLWTCEGWRITSVVETGQ